MTHLTSLLTSFFSTYDLFSWFGISLGGLSLGKIVTVLVRMIGSTQKKMYDKTMTTCLFIIEDVNMRLFQWLQSIPVI